MLKTGKEAHVNKDMRFHAFTYDKASARTHAIEESRLEKM